MALQCRVKLLDGSEFLLDLEKKEVGKFVFDQVLRRLGLTDKDKDYFGMQYEDDQTVPQWLDLTKQVKKQLKKPPFNLMFKVKYYPLDPVPHPAGRTHFYRQFRHDLISGKMKCPTHNVPDILACILQADMGDYESTEQDVEFMTDQRLIVDQSLDNAAVQDEVAKLHKLHKGNTPQEAVKTFLRRIRELETYGIRLYDVKYDDSACQLGLSPHGVSLFRRSRRIFIYDWLMVSQISFKTKKFIVMVEKEMGGDMQLTFEMDSMKSSKEIWTTCREYAEFYTEPRRRIQEEPDPQTNVRSPGALDTTNDQFSLPAPVPLLSELNQKDDSKSMDTAQKVKSLPRYLPPSRDPVADALRLKRHKKARSTSPEDANSTSTPAGGVPISELPDPSRPADYDRRDQLQYPDSQQHQHHQQSRDPNQLSHDPNQWSHDQRGEVPQHYDNLKCRDDYLAKQLQAQQHQQMLVREQTDIQMGDPPPVPPHRSIASDLNPAQASRSHSTINPEELSSQDQDMDGSLLDLADELGEAESPSTGQNHRMVEEGDVAGPTAVQQTAEKNGFMHESPLRMADHQVNYNSNTLPHSFSSKGGRSLRPQSDGGSDGPPKPPRTDYPQLEEYRGSSGGMMQGTSPFVPGSSFTTGRQYQKKRNLVRNWVQDQQLRTYQSSSSRDSSAHSSPSSLRHLQQQSSPDIRGIGGQQNGRLSTHSSLGSAGRSPAASPSHPRSRDTQNRYSGSSPSHMMRPAVPQGQSRDQQKPYPPSASQASAAHTPMPANGHPVAQQESGRSHTWSHSRSPNHQKATVSSSTLPLAHQDNASPDSSPPQEPYRQRTSETVNQMQSDPQVPVLIQQIDELMGGLLDSPLSERKEESPPTQKAITSTDFGQLVQPSGPMVNGGGPKQSSVVVASGSPFLSNINPADFLRDEEIRIDPRNFLNTPSPEPTLLDLKGTSSSTSFEMAVSGLTTATHQPSPLVGGILSSKLQQAIDEEADYHDPPPPPPHLVALTQGFKDIDRRSGTKPKKQLPSVSPKPHSSVASSVGKQVDKMEQKKQPGKEHTSKYNPSNLPPEIASFVTRVRNRSVDGADPTTHQPQHGRQPSGESMRRLASDGLVNPPETHVTASPTYDVPRSSVSPTYDIPRSSVSPTFDPLKVEVSSGSSQRNVPATVERVTITPDRPVKQTTDSNLSTPQHNGRPSSAEISPTMGSISASAAVYPEAYIPGASIKEQDHHHNRSTEADSGIGGGSAGSGGQQSTVTSGGEGAAASSSDLGGMYSYASYRQSNQDKRDQLMQQQQRQQDREWQPAVAKDSGQNQQMGWDSEVQKTKHEVDQPQQILHQMQPLPPPQQQPHQQYQLRSQPAKTTVSLTRGQVLGDHHRHESHGSSDGSAPTTPHAHSDLAIPRSTMQQARSPMGRAPDSFGYKYQPYATSQQPPSSRSTRGYYPPQQQQQMGYYPPPQDIRRAQTFSLGQGQPRPTRVPHHYHQHPGGEDSLPNSPTYFAQNPPRLHNRGVLSPNTVANNRSFQEHLDTLNTTRHGRKMRVLDWMQKQQAEEHHRMVKDPSAELPSEPYFKQSHIYASAAELEQPPPSLVSVPPNPAEYRRPGSAQGQGSYQPQERGRSNTAPYSHTAVHAYPQSRPPPPQQAPGMARVQVDRGRGYINVSPHGPPAGSHISPYHYPHQPPMGSGGNMGRMAGTPANAQNLPTAKFEKDYYILDV